MVAPTTTISKIRRRIDDLSETDPLVGDFDIIDEAVLQAVSRYAQDRPRVLVEDETGNGTPYYVLVGTGALLASWADGFSQIRQIEYPAAAVGASHTPSYLEQQDDWDTTYRDATKTYLRLRSVSPSASETLRITYTALHTHTTVTDTVPPTDLDALCDLAASYVCQALASSAASTLSITLGQFRVSGSEGQASAAKQASAWLASYQRRIGVDTSGATAGAASYSDWDASLQYGGRFLTHGGRRR